MKLYYHKTTGGAEYLCSNYIEWEHNGKKGREGVFKGSKYIVRIDGDIEVDAELNINENFSDDELFEEYVKVINEVSCREKTKEFDERAGF